MTQVNHSPTEAQKRAGNYKKEHIQFHGLPISIENKRGSVRRGIDASGKPWSCTLPADYGYIKRTEGADGDHVDVYVGPDSKSPHAFIINQKDLHTGRFDEHKVMLGYPTERSAALDYCAAFSDGRGRQRMASMEPLSIDAFKRWLRTGDTTKSARSRDILDHVLQLCHGLGKPHV